MIKTKYSHRVLALETIPQMEFLMMQGVKSLGLTITGLLKAADKNYLYLVDRKGQVINKFRRRIK